jgi:hypothetical protein
MQKQIFIGFDPREAAAFAVARHTVLKNLSEPVPVRGLVLSDLQARGLYTRPLEWRPGVDHPVMWDTISDAAMSTEHACARFLIKHLAGSGWAVFMDGDMLARGDIAKLLDTLDPKYAVYCVKHKYEPTAATKMDGQAQARYSRKNWSSFLVVNADHVSNHKLTLEMVNTLPGRDLHRFCWLEDDEIGELGQSWNFLVGHTDPEIVPDVIHWTQGPPDMRGFEDTQFADEWRAARADWAIGALSPTRINSEPTRC